MNTRSRTLFEEYRDYDGLGLAELVAKGEVAPSELVESCLDAIARHNPALNCVVHRMDKQAREAAAGELPDGPFKGVPFLIKDLLAHIAGEPTSCGSRFTRDWIPGYDAELTKRYRASGLVFAGKTNTPEHGITGHTNPAVWGACRNPWNTAHTPGGSSGGAAAAVAAGIVPMAHGGDGGGSIRIPAAMTGLVGLKPTRGRTPLGPGLGEDENGLVSQHAITRTVRDCAALLDVTRGGMPGDPYHCIPPRTPYLKEVGKKPGKLKIGLFRGSLFGSALHPHCRDAVDDAGKLLEDLGHHVEDTTPVFDKEGLIQAYFTIVCSSVASAIDDLARTLGREPKGDDLELSTWLVANIGRKQTAADLQSAIKRIHTASRDMAAFHERYDLLVTSTLGQPPSRLTDLEFKQQEVVGMSVLRALPVKPLLDVALQQLGSEGLEPVPNTQLFNQTGQPAMSLPLCWSPDGLPLGIQFVAPFGDEKTLFRIAGQLEKARPWADKRPPGY